MKTHAVPVSTAFRLLVALALVFAASVASAQVGFDESVLAELDSPDNRPESPAAPGDVPVEDTTPAVPADGDILGAALQKLQATRADLGVHPNPTWTRFPQPSQIPHVLPFFTGTYSDPLRLYDLARTMGNTVERYLQPGSIDDEAQALHKLVYYLVVDKQRSGFRDYSVNLPETDLTLMQALELLWAQTDGTLETRAFGKVVRSREELEASVAALPAGLQEILAQLTVSLLDASDWRRKAMRHVPQQSVTATWQELHHIQDQDSYQMHLDDVSRFLDPLSMAYANMKTVQAAQDARRALKTWMQGLSGSQRKKLESVQFAQETPLGWVIVGSSQGETHAHSDVLWMVDLGGDDLYTGSIAASTPLAPLSVCIDMQGNDTWRSENDRATQGAGILGAGVLIDASGDDQYQARRLAQGFGVFGIGLLLDEAGNDRYTVETAGQGCGFFGGGLCLDVEGNDQYAIVETGQGFGGVGGGIGILADHQGRDHYKAEAFVETASSQTVRTSNAQGVGRGRRGDGADGHSWAGGLGALLDIAGRDTYESGNWSLGAGYWFGTGVAYDASGDDIYRSVYFTQAAGAHYANGVLVDEAGDDQHVLFETAGAAFAFGWDYANALLVDKSGNDRYEAQVTSFGRADIRSTALFVDLDGNDRYQLGTGQRGFGAADFLESYKVPDTIAPYNSEARSFGLFLDGGGEDRYQMWDAAERKATAATLWGENRAWRTPRPGDDGYGFGNHGLGWDVARGTVPEFLRFDPERVPTPE